MKDKSKFTLIERSKIYTQAMHTFLLDGIEATKRNRIYPFGLCFYIRNTAEWIVPEKRVVFIDKNNFPEFHKQKPFFQFKDGYWWRISGREAYEKRTRALTKAIALVNKKIANDRKTKGPMVLGDTSQSDTGQHSCTVHECN